MSVELSNDEGKKRVCVVTERERGVCGGRGFSFWALSISAISSLFFLKVGLLHFTSLHGLIGRWMMTGFIPPKIKWMFVCLSDAEDFTLPLFLCIY